MLLLWRASFKRMMRERMPGQSRNSQRKSFFLYFRFRAIEDDESNKEKKRLFHGN